MADERTRRKPLATTGRGVRDYNSRRPTLPRPER
ncbi:hypothetical protein chiPu_0022509, partial [Chiloscyllium punctatum]|nr:hypothetical protein [Chiloscyllium punctatum]